jgi:hypothetical protein
MISGCLDSFNPRLFTSAYQFDLQIQTDNPLYNVTFIIPLPVNDGIPVVGSKTLTADDFQQPGISATLTQSPPGLNLTGSVPLQGYQPWFVILKADEMAPVNGSSMVYSMKKDDYIQHTQLKNFRIVPSPVGIEFLIMPKFNFTWKDPEVEKAKLYVIWYKPYKFPHDTLLYADYNTNPSANVTISFMYYGKNMWFEEYDNSYVNTYQEPFSTQLNGNNHGWHRVSGFIMSEDYPWGFEQYPNATNPEWQQALNQTPPY